MTESYRDIIKRAQQLVQAGDPAGAVAAYREAVALAPQRPDAHYELALLHHRQGEISEAVAAFQKVVDLNPQDASAWNNLGVLHFSEGMLEEAETCFSTAIAIDGRYTEAMYNLAKIYIRQEEAGKAAIALRRCLEIDPAFERAEKALEQYGIPVGLPVWQIPAAPQREDKLARLRGKEPIRIRVLSPSETEQDMSKRILWGDHWVKHELERALQDLGLMVVENNPNVILYLFGVPVNGLPDDIYNMVWLYSHPDMVTPHNLRQFDKIFCLSSSYMEKLRAMGYENVELMIGATSKKPLQVEKQYDIVFVGNARQTYGRQVITDIGDVPYNFKVWGNGWDTLLPRKYYGGRYHDYEKLDELYASSLISINDHHPDMAREGFVAVKIFDILASGGFAISDKNSGIREIFGDTVPQYESPEHLRALLDLYINNPDERLKQMEKGRDIALSHTYRKRAEQIRQALEPVVHTGRQHPVAVPDSAGSRQAAKMETRVLKVLYVDTLSTPHAACNVNGMTKAYAKVSNLRTFDYRALAQQYGQAQMNQMLVQVALEFKPDLIHLGKSESVYGATIGEIKRQIDTYVIHFYGDFRWDPQPWVVDIGKYADCTLFNYTDDRILDKYRAAGVKKIDGFWDAGTDPEIFYPRDGQKTKDVVFMGNNLDIPHDGYEKRRQLVEESLKQGLDVHLYGQNWEYLLESGYDTLHIHPFVTEEEFAAVCSSAKITLGINGVNDVRMYASWRRTVNSMASGAFHLTHYVPDMETLFENRKHLVWFNSVPEAIELIKHYLAHDEEREAIAIAGREKVLAEHTWDARIAAMIERWSVSKRAIQLSDTSSIYPQEEAYRNKVLAGAYAENPELEDDMVESMFIRWRRDRILFSYPQREMYEYIAKRVAGKDVCDVGCGSGLGSVILAQEAKSVVGLEKVGRCTEFSQKCFPLKNVRFANEDIVHCSFPDNQFDVVTAVEVIEHIGDYRGALTQLCRILKEDGTLYISSPNRNSQSVSKHRPGNKYHVREWAADEFHDVLRSYFRHVQFFDFTLTQPQTVDSTITPIMAVCQGKIPAADKIVSRPSRARNIPTVKYNLNFDDFLPSYTDFTLLEELVRLFPDIKITIFVPINSRDWGDNVNNILDHPEWCRRVAQLPSKNFEIALHGYVHHLNDRVKTPEFKYLSKDEARRLILKCEDAFRTAGIPFTKGFRPPRWEISKGGVEALEELNYLYLSDMPKYYELHKDIKIPRIFSTSDIRENEEYCDVKPYRHLLLDSRQYYIHRGHLVSRVANNLTKENFENIVRTIRSFPEVEFRFLSELAEEIGTLPNRGAPTFSPQKQNGALKLHLGCGSVHLDGYVNIDAQDWAGACDIVADATDLSMFGDNTVDHIFNHALLEHIPPWDTMRALREWFRVLKPHGTIQVEVPDLQRVFEDWLLKKTLAEQEAIDNIFGGNKVPNKAYSRQDHLTGFTLERLVRMMADCGYSNFKRLEHPRYHHILVVHAEKGRPV